MSTYKFLIPAEHQMLNVAYLAILEDSIKSIPVADTYDRYGQRCGHSNAGDWVSLNTKESVIAANSAWRDDNDLWNEDVEDKFSIGAAISAYEDSYIFDELLEKFGESSEHISLEQQYVDAIEYHDGHNFRTIILEDDAGHILDYELLDDDELEDELNEAIRQCQYIGEGGGFINYESEKYYITQSNWQGDFESYQISIKNNA